MNGFDRLQDKLTELTSEPAPTYKLVVTVPDERTFNAYWYGYGVLTGVCQVDVDKWEAEIDYGTDRYRAEYQAGRFWSGLYPAQVVSSVDS